MWVPTSATLPLSSKIKRLAFFRVESLWAIAIVVRPLMSFCRLSWINDSVSTSRELVASSRIRMSGFLMIALAMDIRWRSPPEIVCPLSPINVL